jgi:MFS superfamily sulfate permease-like transporter
MVGGKSQLVGIIAALVIALILLFFTAPMAWIPQAALGAVLLMAGWGLIDIKSLGPSAAEPLRVLAVPADHGRRAGAGRAARHRVCRDPGDPAPALQHLPAHRRRARLAAGTEGQVDIRKHKDARTVPGLVVYRFDDAILFFNADYFKMRLLEAVQSQDQPKAVLFDAEAVTSIDVSGIAALREVRDTLAAQGIFAIARARGTFLRMLVRSGMAREMEDKLLFGSVRPDSGVSGFTSSKCWVACTGAQAVGTSNGCRAPSGPPERRAPHRWARHAKVAAF